jgi:hypothetical protein
MSDLSVEPVVAPENGAWVGSAVAALALIATAFVLVRGGGYFVVVPRLAFVAPLAVIGAVTTLAVLRVGRTSVNAVAWLGVIVLAGVAWNFLVYSFKFGSAVWGVLIVLAHPTGLDFRDGLYGPAQAFTTARSGWPPLTLILGRPFTWMSFSTAYTIQVCILVALALAAVFLSARLAIKAAVRPGAAGVAKAAAPDAAGHRGGAGTPLLALVMGAWLLTSYGFMYEVERGNIDLYALVFSLLSVWFMIRSARSPWLPAALLAVAIGLKLYPAVLLVVLVWRYRWRALLPIAVTTVVVLLVAGPANLRHSLDTLTVLQANVHAEWWGQDSATAMAHVLRAHTSWAPAWIWYPLIIVPLGLWAATMTALLRRGWSDRGAVLAAAACVPLMAIVPAVSNDYKLVICVFPLAVLAVVVTTMERRPPVVWAVLFGALSFTMIFLARSTIVVAPSLQASKYTLLVVLQVLLLVVVRMTDQQRETRGATVRIAPEPRSGTLEA